MQKKPKDPKELKAWRKQVKAKADYLRLYPEDAETYDAPATKAGKAEKQPG